MKKSETLTIRIDAALKRRVQKLAKRERRSFADQTAFLLEKVFSMLDAQETNQSQQATTEVQEEQYGLDDKCCPLESGTQQG